ncbi:MAG: phosphate/phosphite/phosphonate ABC transporter substrate-binding protein [Gemmataceae bacterium]|nr:phosphate/phosphite/phosphonate ABC transporter substrate-binding protein [Gemmataceae bacterium]
MPRHRIAIMTILVAAALTAAAAPAEPTVRIGMLKSMFREVPPAMFNAMSTPFQTVVQSQTGLKGQLVIVESAEAMRQQLTTGEVQLGVFHGFEFAWMKLKEKSLEPLMLVSVNPNMLQAVVVVQKDCSAKGVAECRGQKLAMPKATKEHSRLFLQRRCRVNGGTCNDFFPTLQEPPSIEDALDDVVDGVSQVAVVDKAALQMFERRKPGRFARLRILESSEPFPPSVIAFGKGQVDVTTQDKFRSGMSTAHDTALGKHLMGLMKITGFEPVPANFDQRMAESVKAYPPPW